MRINGRRPEPAPVTIAVLPRTDSAIVNGVEFTISFLFQLKMMHTNTESVSIEFFYTRSSMG